MTDNARTATTRRRRANVKGGRVGEHRVKVSAEEEAALVKRATELDISVPRLLVESALALATVERICGSLDEYINASVVAR